MTFLKGSRQVSGWQVPAWELRATSALWAEHLMWDVDATNSHSLSDMCGLTTGLPLDDSFVVFFIYPMQFGDHFFFF